MNRFLSFPPLFALIISSLVVAGCSAIPDASQLHNPMAQGATGSIPSMLDTSGAPVVTSPAVVALNSNLGALEYWPMRPGVHDQPIRISKKGLFNGNGLVANGHMVSFANQNP